jgi:alkanesulfonate monooxygenase SsuD/methylene tetrahydromethanopterin reductase-like flavin-dependent oxidoreductase (luciferase family)
MMATIIPGRTDAEARDRHEELARCVDAEGMLALFSGFSGMDLSKELSGRTGNNGMEGVVEYLLREEKSLERLRRIVTFGPQAGRECFLIGSPVTIADQLQSWMEEADIDGFNLHRAGEPKHLIDFADLVVPELQNRGVYKTAYPEGSFRQKLFGRGDKIDAGHPAARWRRAAA